MKHPIVRHKHGKDFSYTLNGRAVDAPTRERISALAIPPAWTDVEIAKTARSKVQATGYDANGRKQYIYSDTYTKKQQQAKFDRITEFAKRLPRLRSQVEKDLKRRRFDKRKVLAAAVSLMDQEYFRVGNEQYAKDNNSFGLTTLRSKHISITGKKIVFDFVGKSGQQHHKVVNDDVLSKIIAKLDDMPGYELFRYYDKEGTLHNLTSKDVNDYLKGVMGDDFSAKDFRTWGGTLLAAIELAREIRPSSKTERKRAMSACAKKVAAKLGNTPAVARSSYVDPRVFNIYDESDGIKEVYETVKDMKPRKYLSTDECWVLKLLAS